MILPSALYRKHWILSQLSKENWSCIPIRAHSIHLRHLLIFASQWMWRRVWAKQVIPMTMHRWSVTSIHWRMNAQICMSSKQRKNSTKQWRNFPMSTTIMYARIAPTVTVRHIRHESQDKKGLPEQIAWLLKIGTVSFCQGQSCDSGVKHPWWNLTVPIDSKLQSTDFISHKCYKNAWPQQRYFKPIPYEWQNTSKKSLQYSDATGCYSGSAFHSSWCIR